MSSATTLATKTLHFPTLIFYTAELQIARGHQTIFDEVSTAAGCDLRLKLDNAKAVISQMNKISVERK